MNASGTSNKDMPGGDNDKSESSENSSDESIQEPLHHSSSSESEYSESSLLGSGSEFGPEATQPIAKELHGLDSTAWVPTFKERVGENISRLLNDSLKFCVSGKMDAPPIISISFKKVEKRISFPLYDDMLDSLIPAFEQSAFGRGTETVLDTSFRNSWELGHMDFEIMNTEWNSYLTDVVQPLIRRDLSLDVGFRLSLYKLLLYKTGSFFKRHRDSEKNNGMFGTVVIQLPSFYDGGKLIVCHNHRTEEVDLSSAVTPQNAFSTFYTAFYCDCEHEILPITNGVRTCLVYNLVLQGEIQREIVPSAARLEVEGREADLVDLIRNSWSNEQKLVYCLSHKYTQKSLSMENLKSSDRLIGGFFQKYADSCGLEVMIGILKRKKYRYADASYKPRQVQPRPRREPNHMYWYNIENGYHELNWHHHDRDDDYDEIATISDVDSNDPNVEFYDDYKIKYLKSLDKDRSLKLPSLDVDFEREVLPENSFQQCVAFHENQEVTGNEGVQCSKYYQCAAIMVYHPDDLLSILVEGHAKLSKIEELFLNEFKKHKDNIGDAKVKGKCLKWCHIVMDRLLLLSRLFVEDGVQKTSEMFEAFLMLDDVELMRKFLKSQKIEQGNFSYMHRVCHKHGWSTFTAEILSKFEKLKPDQRFVILQKFIDYGGSATQQDVDKHIIIHGILKEMLTKFDYELEHPYRQSYHRYSPKPLRKEQRENATKKFLISMWPLANRVNFLPIVEYAKKQSMNVMVPVLITVGQNKENISNLWMDVADYFKSKMEVFLQSPMDPTLTWRQNVTLSCNCKHCKFVQDFLHRAFQQKLDFFGKKPVRDHVQQTLAGMENLSFWTLASGSLRIKKPRKTGEVQSEKHRFVTDNLSKLCALITSAST